MLDPVTDAFMSRSGHIDLDVVFDKIIQSIKVMEGHMEPAFNRPIWEGIMKSVVSNYVKSIFEN